MFVFYLNINLYDFYQYIFLKFENTSYNFKLKFTIKVILFEIMNS